MTRGTITFTVAPPATNQAEDWNNRSRGPGVVWAHNFEHQDEIAKSLIFVSITQYTAQNTDPMAPYREAAPEFGANAGVLVSRTRSALLREALPVAPLNSPGTIKVYDASNFIDPTTYYNRWYLLLIGHATNLPPFPSTVQQEIVKVTAIDYATNTLTVERGYQTYKFATEAPAFAVDTPIGTDDLGRWNRIMMPLVAGQNGKTTDDIGIANGYRTRNWTWSANAHGRFRGAYWGHEATHAKFDAQWPPVDDYSVGNFGATYGYLKPSASVPTIFNCFAHANPQMCNEFWIQWRMKIPSLKMQDAPGKLMYLHTAHKSLQQQLFMGISAETESVAGAPGGTGPRVILACRNGPEIEGNGGTIMDTQVPYNHWLDTWATWMIRVKPGRGTREWPEFPGPLSAGGPGAPEGVIELYVAGPSDSAFTLIKRTSNFAHYYGIPFTIFRETPAMYNAFNPCNYPNNYMSQTSSSGAPLTNHAVKYAQVILSRYAIPCPLPLT
jgi:hypothetical protein